MKANEVYRSIMFYYNGDNKVNSMMKNRLVSVYNDLLEEIRRTVLGEFGSIEYYKPAIEHLMNKAMNARSFRGFERSVRKLSEFFQYPINLANYTAAYYEERRAKA